MTGLPPSSADPEVETLKVALRESEDRLRFLMDAVTEYAIFSLGTDGVIESWNTGAERIKGYPPAVAVGQHFSMLYTAEERDEGAPQTNLDRALMKPPAGKSRGMKPNSGATSSSAPRVTKSAITPGLSRLFETSPSDHGRGVGRFRPTPLRADPHQP